MRVAHYLPMFPSMEGITTFCRGLCPALTRAGVPCSIITQKETDEILKDVKVLRYPVSQSRNPFQAPRRIVADLSSGVLGIDLMILHGMFNPSTAAMAHDLRRLRIPYVFVPHDPYHPRLLAKGRLKKRIYWHLVEEPLIRRSSAVQLLCDDHLKYLPTPLRSSIRTFTVPNGTVQTVLSEDGASGFGEGQTRGTKILFLGRIDANHKGLDLLIRGFAQFGAEKSDHEVRLELTGKDSGDRPSLEALARELGVQELVTFTGPREESTSRIIDECELLVLPSRYDGWGLVALEAMDRQKPVIVSSEAGVAAEVLKSGAGIVCEPEPDAIARAISRMLSMRPRWSEIGRCGRLHVAENLTWDRVAKRSAEEYEKVVRAHRGPSSL